MLIVGDEETKKESVSVRARGSKDLGIMTVEKFSEILSNEIEKKN